MSRQTGAFCYLAVSQPRKSLLLLIRGACHVFSIRTLWGGDVTDLFSFETGSHCVDQANLKYHSVGQVGLEFTILLYPAIPGYYFLFHRERKMFRKV